MANEIQKTERTGKLSVVHKAMIWAFAEFFIWIGQSLKKVESYEDLSELGGIVEEKMEELDNKYDNELQLLEDAEG